MTVATVGAEWLEDQIAPVHQSLLEHPIYRALDSVEALRTFTEHHVFAVWDFMALLVRLRKRFASPTEWWLPPSNGVAMRAVNEIMVAEETDDAPLEIDGCNVSHFDLYVAAMAQLGAGVAAVNGFRRQLGANRHPVQAMLAARAPRPACTFVDHTVQTAVQGTLPEAAAAFAYGRERVIPPMFELVLDSAPAATALLRTYLERHVELDGGVHGSLARDLVTAVCTDERDWTMAAHAAQRALRARSALWDGIMEALNV